MTFRKLNHCKVDFKDGVSEPIPDALVRMNGASVVISSYDGFGRTKEADRITDAVVTEDGRGGKLVITGVSQFLKGQVNVPEEDLQITVHVTPGAGCRNCG